MKNTTRKPRGVTLIEIMIVVAVIGILAAVVFPTFMQQLQKSHRVAAITGVMEVASREARYYTINNTYTSSLSALGYASTPLPLSDSTNHYYDLLITAASSTGFTVSATPTGSQRNDACGTFTYNDLGVKAVSSGNVSDCWKQ